MKLRLLTLPCLAALMFSSCIGVATDITIRADGSGTIALEYRASQMLESIGRLDGNENYPAVPAGKADFERGLARIPGLRLASFSSKEKPDSSGGGDLLTSAKLEFTGTDALLAFMDGGSGYAPGRAFLTTENGKNTLRLVLLEPSADSLDPDLLSLLRETSAGYEISLSLTAPSDAVLSVSPPSVTTARIVERGKKVSFAMALADAAALRDGLALNISW